MGVHRSCNVALVALPTAVFALAAAVAAAVGIAVAVAAVVVAVAVVAALVFSGFHIIRHHRP